MEQKNRRFSSPIICKFPLFVLLVLFLLTNPVKSHKDEAKQQMLEGKMKKLAMSPKEVEKVEQLHYGWYVQAISALIGAMGKEMYDTMDRSNKKAFVACMNKIEKEYDLQMGADCLVKAFDGALVSSYPDAVNSPQFDFVDKDITDFEAPKLREEKKIRKSLLKKISMKKTKKMLTKVTIKNRSLQKNQKKDTASRKNSAKQLRNGVATKSKDGKKAIGIKQRSKVYLTSNRSFSNQHITSGLERSSNTSITNT